MFHLYFLFFPQLVLNLRPLGLSQRLGSRAANFLDLVLFQLFLTCSGSNQLQDLSPDVTVTAQLSHVTSCSRFSLSSVLNVIKLFLGKFQKSRFTKDFFSPFLPYYLLSSSQNFLPLIPAPTSFHSWGFVIRWGQLLTTSNYYLPSTSKDRR